MSIYKVVLKGGFEMTVDANNLNHLYTNLKEAGLEIDRIAQMWVKLNVRLEDNDV